MTAENLSDGISPLISDLCVLDSEIPVDSADRCVLQTTGGSYENADDYALKSVDLTAGRTSYFAPEGGRSSDRAWPYFDVTGDGTGFLLAVGWSGQWKASFRRTDDRTVRVRVKQQYLEANLLPGEKIRTPRIVLTFFDGDAVTGHNIFRRLVVSDYSPRGFGGESAVPVSLNFWGGRTESFISRTVKRFSAAGIGADAVWLDAGWYADFPSMGEYGLTAGNSSPEKWSMKLGQYGVNKNLFPGGSMKNVSDSVHGSGYRFMLWWMIEDGCAEAAGELTFGRESYYDLSVDIYGAERLILRLDDDTVLERVLEYFRKKISDEGVDWIRIDSMVRPLNFWLDNDKILAADDGCTRNGITENRYITNFYRLWDTLYSEYDGFYLDNCASGGRRLDIEMVRRSVALWRTDHTSSDRQAMASQMQSVSYWLPYVCGGLVTASEDPYDYRLLYSSGLNLYVPKEDISDSALGTYRKILREYGQIRKYYSGAYYQLVPQSREPEGISAFMFFRDDLDSGFLTVAAHEKYSGGEMTFRVRGLDPSAVYTVHDIDDVKKKRDITLSGAQLASSGLTVSPAAGTVTLFMIQPAQD